MLGIISTKNLNQMSTAQIMYFVCRRQTELGLFRFKAGKIKLGKKKKKKQKEHLVCITNHRQLPSGMLKV